MLIAVYLLFLFFMAASLQLRPGASRSNADTSVADAPVAVTALAGANVTETHEDAPNASEELVRIVAARCNEVGDQYGLSPRERDVLRLLAQGRTSGAIQEELTLAASTVKTHMQHIYAKVGVNDRQQLMEEIFEKTD